MIRFLLLFSLLLSVSTTAEQTFLDSVNDAYEQYTVIVDEEREIGDLTIVAGAVKGKYSLSAFLLNNATSQNHRICVYVDEKLTTFVPDGGVVAGYGLEFKENAHVKIYLVSDNDELLVYEADASNLMSAVNDSSLKGNGSAIFPKNKRESDLLSKLRLFLILFVVAAILLAVFLILMYKRAMGRFSGKKEEPLYDYEQPSEDEPRDAEFSVEEENKEAIMDRLFEEFRRGDLTEDELNEKLKKLWWHNDD